MESSSMSTIRMMVITDQIAGHEKAISAYTQAIADLTLQAKGDPIINTLINQYISIVRILIKEWKEMNYEICNISNRDHNFGFTHGGDRLFPRSAHLQRSAIASSNSKPTL
jgi:hypothetical protein